MLSVLLSQNSLQHFQVLDLETLCTVHAQAGVIGNCTLCISGEDALPGLILIFANTGSMGTTLCSLAKGLAQVLVKSLPAFGSSNLI